MKKRFFFTIAMLAALLCFFFCQNQDAKQERANKQQKYSYRGWNLLSNHRENGMKTLDAAVENNINHIELSHYQLCHFLKDLKKDKNREDVNFFIQQAHQRGINDVFVWEHAFYNIDYYPDRFKVKPQKEQDFSHHATHFEGGMNEQLNLDDPLFWQWVYQDYDSLLALAPAIDGIVLTFIETGSYVIYQHSEKHPTPAQKTAMLVDSLANYFINKKGLKLTIRTFIYNQFEKQSIVNALQKIENEDIKVMIKMTPHDWFLTYPYQDFVAQIPFPVIIEYDCGMEYAGENIIANPFAEYFTNAFKHYHQYENVIGFCARTDRYHETSAIGTPGELNLFVLSQLAENIELNAEELSRKFIEKKYGKKALPHLLSAFNSAFDFVLASMYTLGTHTANHSRLNFHRQNIYTSHTTGEWYAPDKQMRHVAHNVNRDFHNYKDIINALSFPVYKTDTAALCRDICWVVDSGWLSPKEEMTKEFLDYIVTEKNYAVETAENMLKHVEKAIPLIESEQTARNLFHTFRRSLIFAKQRRGAAQAVYGYRLWNKSKAHQTSRLREIILDGLNEAEAMLDSIDNYPVHVPLGQWRWHRDREAFEIYKKAIRQTGWKEMELEEVVN